MASQRELNSYTFRKIVAALSEYSPEDGDREITYSEAVEALRSASVRMKDLNLKF